MRASNELDTLRITLPPELIEAGTQGQGNYMQVDELINEAAERLGLDNPAILTQGGQKIVLSGQLAGTDAVAKVVLVPDGPSGNTVVERAQREVELLAAVECPNVVAVLTDAIQIGDRPEAICWAEEMLSGQDLSSQLGSPWHEKDVWKLLTDVSNGLKACHELEVVHRDLSPGNVRQTDDGGFVLMDPGFARHLAKTALTGQYQPGTPGYLSPEHVPGGRPVPASDIFSLGILAFAALTGQLPIAVGAADNDYLVRLKTKPCADIASLRTDIGSDLRTVVNRCLEHQPARRFLDGAELCDELNSLRAGAS